MMDELQLFRGRDYSVNNKITIHHPTLNEICNYGERDYFGMVYGLCATPSDYKVQLLDNFGINYEQISEFELFTMISRSFTAEDTAIIFGDLNFGIFKLAESVQTEDLAMVDQDNGIVIDNTIYTLITNYLRSLHGFEKRIDIGGNEHSKQYLLDKERRKLKYAKTEHYKSTLAPLVSAMVNCSEFKYNHTTVWDLPIYMFMDSVKRIQKLKNYELLMQGAYAGNVDLQGVAQDSLNWMGSLSAN